MKGTRRNMRGVDECDIEEFCKLDVSEKTITILGDRWRPPAAKQEWYKMSKTLLCNIWKQTA